MEDRSPGTVSASQTAMIDVREVDKEVRRVASSVDGLSTDVAILKRSVCNLEAGQLTSEVYMHELLKAQGISAESIQARVTEAKRAMVESQVQRGLLSFSSTAAVSAKSDTAAQQSGEKSLEGTTTGKHPRSESAVPHLSQRSLGDDPYVQDARTLSVTTLHGMLCEHGGIEAVQRMKHHDHCDYVAAVSHVIPDGLFLIVKVISGVDANVRPWSLRRGRVCGITKKGSLSWRLDLDSNFPVGRGWTADTGKEPIYNVPMNLVFFSDSAGQLKLDSLNPPAKQARLGDAPESSSSPLCRATDASRREGQIAATGSADVVQHTQVHDSQSEPEYADDKDVIDPLQSHELSF